VHEVQLGQLVLALAPSPQHCLAELHQLLPCLLQLQKTHALQFGSAGADFSPFFLVCTFLTYISLPQVCWGA
jgi:hypothetical protein